MSSALRRTSGAALALLLFAGQGVAAQRTSTRLPRTRADALLEMGHWPAAEEAFYGQSRAEPREPVARAALGRYLAMKGAVLPGTILIEEAEQFGLDSAIGEAMIKPWRAVLGWRSIAVLKSDSVLGVRPPRDSTALFQLPLPRRSANSSRRGALGSGTGRYRDTLWADVVPRQIGADSLYTQTPSIGVELIEGLVPSYDTTTHRLTLHADPRSATRAEGQRYAVLRDSRGIRVLMTPGRTISLAAALREMEPAWWQLDLLHGMLIVR